MRQVGAKVSAGGSPHGTDLLPRDITADELNNSPALSSLSQLLIEDLTHDIALAFAAAIARCRRSKSAFWQVLHKRGSLSVA